MSKRLSENRSFLTLLLEKGDKGQQRALMQTITNNQLDAIGEIFYNLIHIVPIDKSEEKIIKRSRKILQRVSAISKSAPSRRKLLKSNRVKFLKILHQFSDRLLGVIRASPLQ